MMGSSKIYTFETNVEIMNFVMLGRREGVCATMRFETGANSSILRELEIQLIRHLLRIFYLKLLWAQHQVWS